MADESNESPIEQYDAWSAEDAGKALPPKERFRKSANIALLLSYDLVDKLRYFEKDTMEQPEDEIERRQVHVAKLVEELRVAYLDFAELDF